MSLAVLVISAVTYLSSIEPTASFWDCGEFIASSYKLEVGHPPGNPVFQLFARVFTIPVDASHAAVAVNAMNAILSALTIFLLYFTIVFFAKRLIGKKEEFSLGEAIAIFGSGAVGALAYCFSDTFWFSAVEGEVYAMSSLFTALVFWAMCKWYDQADEPHANRWIVLISFLMGLSIGVHLLNLLTIPAFVFMYYYRKNEDKKLPFKKLAGIFAIGVVIEFVLVYLFIPYFPKTAAWFDRIFVNGFGLPYNSGALFFLVGVLALCFWGLFVTLRKEKVFLNTVLLCVTTLAIRIRWCVTSAASSTAPRRWSMASITALLMRSRAAPTGPRWTASTSRPKARQTPCTTRRARCSSPACGPMQTSAT